MRTEMIASLGITMPIFLIMLLGIVFRRIGLMSENFAKELNRFVFRIALPVSIFQQLYQADFKEIWDPVFVLLCFFVTAAQILFAALLSRAACQAEDRGEFVQASYRSSTALLGVTYLQQAYGTASASALMMLGCVPLYNVAAVYLLSKNEDGPAKSKQELLLDIIKNPIVLSILIGFIFSVFRISIPAIGKGAIRGIASLASPAGLLAMGAGVRFRELGRQKKAIGIASLLKLVGFSAATLPFAVRLGYTGEKLMAILIMTGSATTIAAYTMAKSMGHEGELTAGTVMFTTLASAITLTLWIFFLRSFGLL